VLASMHLYLVNFIARQAVKWQVVWTFMTSSSIVLFSLLIDAQV